MIDKKVNEIAESIFNEKKKVLLYCSNIYLIIEF